MALPTVIVLNDYCQINGGASHVAIDEATGLAAAGHRVIFFAPCGPVCEELQQPNIEVICLNQPELINVGSNPGVMLQGLWNQLAYRRMKALLRTLDPANTIVHLHGYTKALSTSPVRAALKRGFPVLCSLHDFFTACPNGAFFDYTKMQVCPKRGMSLDCISTNCDKRNYVHKLYRVVRSFVQKQFGMLPRGVKHYINLSNRSVQVLRPYLPRDVRFYQLDNIINVPHLPPIDVAANDTIVAVGRLDIEKGIEVLLQAIRQTGMKLKLVGDGPLRAQAESAPGCTVTGWLTPDKVVAELEQARCLVLPSLWYEGLPMVVTEAAARGVPAIVSDVSASAERVQDGVHGWHVKTGDAADLVRCLLLTKDDSQLKKQGEAAYKCFWENPPTRANHIAGLKKIYESVLADTF